MKTVYKFKIIIVSCICLHACGQDRESHQLRRDSENLIVKLNDPIKMKRLDSLRAESFQSLKNGTIDYVDFYEKALKIDSTDLLNRVNHAYSLLNFKNDKQAAIMEIRNTLKLYPEAPDVLFALGTMLLSTDSDSAFFYCEKAVAIDPNNYIDLYSLSKYYETLNMYSNAINSINKALKIQPNNIGLKLIRGSYKLGAEDYQGGFDDMDTIPKEFQKNSTIYFNRAKCAYNIQRFKECIKDCDEAIRLEPGIVSEVYLIRGLAKAGLKDFDGGYTDVKTAYDAGNRDAAEAYGKFQEYYKTHKKK